MKRRKKYDSPVVLQQAEVLLELAFLQNSSVEANQVILDSGLKAGASDYGVSQSYSAGEWDMD